MFSTSSAVMSGSENGGGVGIVEASSSVGGSDGEGVRQRTLSLSFPSLLMVLGVSRQSEESDDKGGEVLSSADSSDDRRGYVLCSARHPPF